MREIKTHRGPHSPVNAALILEVGDDPGADGSNLSYQVSVRAGDFTQKILSVKFHRGDPTQGVNGVTLEVLLVILLDRLKCWQGGSTSCRQNALVITKLEEALLWLGHRAGEKADEKSGGGA